MDKEVIFCDCGKVLGHKDKCLSIRYNKDGRKEKIGKYSGKSKSEFAFNEYK